MVRVGILPIVRFLADGGIPEWSQVGRLLFLGRTDTLGDSSSRSCTNVDGEQCSPVEIEPSSKHCIGYMRNSMSARRRWRNLHLLIGRLRALWLSSIALGRSPTLPYPSSRPRCARVFTIWMWRRNNRLS